MTTIAVNSKMMAGDRQFTHSGGTIFTGKTKIYELPPVVAKEIFDSKKVFVGFCGNADNFSSAIEWLFSPIDKQPKLRQIEMLMLNDKGHIYHATTLSNWMRITDEHFSIGSGMQYATAAMASGKTPFEAVKIASKYDVYTGRGFNKLEM